MDKAFRSAAASGKRELVIKNNSAPESQAIQSGQYDSLFSIKTLNYLHISGFSELSSLPGEWGQLDSMLQLILTQNQLTTLPSELAGLSKLKHLDASQNQLHTLPDSLYRLTSLHTLILSHNALTDASFPPPPESLDLETALPNLHHVDLLGNSLTALPQFVYSSSVIQELIASDNAITALEPGIASLVSLKHIDLKRNKLTSLPHALTACTKLKVMRFEENPLSDRRLLKLVAQHGASKPKAVLDYVASHAPKTTPSPVKSKAKGAKRSVDLKAYKEDDDDVIFADGKKGIEVCRPVQYVEVAASPEARAVRPYLVCAVVRGVDLTDDVLYKEFIALQTRLHDTVCKRRRVATIATHDLNKFTPPLRYSCGPAPSISFTPLNWTTPLTAERFLKELEASKGDKRGGGGKGKKGQSTVQANPVAAALSKYVQFVKSDAMVYLQDKVGVVISVPPLTNSEATKIGPNTTDLFLEVTSSDSLGACKQVMDGLVCAMCEAGVGVRDDRLTVEQVKVVDERGQVLVLYPSRTDLQDTVFEVSRPQ